jgi:hypothetical protein
METKKIMALFAAMLVSLSVVGFAYSGWTDQVTIEGTAHMGEFIVGILTRPLPCEWQCDIPYKLIETTNGYPETGEGAPTFPAPESFIPKPWVANTTVRLDDFRTSVHHDPVQTVAHTMFIEVDNAYPQYDVHIEFLMKNAGTIPAHIRCLFLNATATTGDLTPWDMEMIEAGWVYVDGCWVNKGALVDPRIDEEVILWRLSLEVPRSQDPEAVQLEPCNHYFAKLEFEFTQEAEQCHTYTFAFMVDAIQWNMDWEWDI